MPTSPEAIKRDATHIRLSTSNNNNNIPDIRQCVPSWWCQPISLSSTREVCHIKYRPNSWWPFSRLLIDNRGSCVQDTYIHIHTINIVQHEKIWEGCNPHVIPYPVRPSIMAERCWCVHYSRSWFPNVVKDVYSMVNAAYILCMSHRVIYVFFLAPFLLLAAAAAISIGVVTAWFFMGSGIGSFPFSVSVSIRCNLRQSSCIYIFEYIACVFSCVWIYLCAHIWCGYYSKKKSGHRAQANKCLGILFGIMFFCYCRILFVWNWLVFLHDQREGELLTNLTRPREGCGRGVWKPNHAHVIKIKYLKKFSS